MSVFGQADLGLALVVSPDGATPPQTLLTLEFTVVNNGPEDVQAFTIFSGPAVGVVGVPNSITCKWATTTDPPGLQVRSLELLAAGESRTCTGTTFVDFRATGTPELEWRINNPAIQDDPDQSNDTVLMRLLLYAPRSVPAIDTLAALFLSILLGATAFYRSK